MSGATRPEGGIDRSPTRLGRWASTGAGVLALVSVGLYSWSALVAGVLGLSLLLAGLGRGTGGLVDVGVSALVAGGVIAGADGAPVLVVLVGVALAVLAWDTGWNAVGVGAHLGREADTVRLEAVHLAASAAVAALVVVAGFGLYRLGTGDQPVAALVFLVVAAVLLVEALS